MGCGFWAFPNAPGSHDLPGAAGMGDDLDKADSELEFVTLGAKQGVVWRANVTTSSSQLMGMAEEEVALNTRGLPTVWKRDI